MNLELSLFKTHLITNAFLTHISYFNYQEPYES